MQQTDEAGAPAVQDRGRWWTLANGLTLVRCALAPVCAISVANGNTQVAFATFWLAVLTDYVDGPIARRRGEASALGGLLDHATDAFFVTCGAAALAFAGLAPAFLAPLIALAFIQYTLDSRALAGHRLRTSLIGRWNGIAYYVLLGTPITRDQLAIAWPGDALILALGWALVATSIASIFDRAQAWLKQSRA